MRTNDSLTLYAKGVNTTTRTETWTRYVVSRVYWENRRAAPFSSIGSLRANSIVVYIPFANYPAAGIKPGDVIVRGTVTDEITPAFTMTALLAKYSEAATVAAVDKMDMGGPSIKHYQVEGS
jgi:hypothetical protein